MSADHLSERRREHLRASGGLSEEEVSGLESAETEEDREAIMRGFRARHAAARLAGSVATGAISADEAATLVEEVRRGGHSPALRSRINEVARLAATDGDGDGDG